MKPRTRVLLLCLLVVAFAGCEREPPIDPAGQRYFFLESLKQVETAGQRLGQPDLNQQQLTAALQTLDDALGLAFQVRRAYLDEFDLRLGKNFERYFIKGVENYRLGIEAGDRQQQIEGIRLLNQWAEFWQAEGDAIEARITAR